MLTPPAPSDTTDLRRLRRRKLLTDWLFLGFVPLFFGWIPAGLALASGDPHLRPVTQILWLLVPLLLLWLAAVCLFFWRWSLIRKIQKMESHPAAKSGIGGA